MWYKILKRMKISICEGRMAARRGIDGGDAILISISRGYIRSAARGGAASTRDRLDDRAVLGDIIQARCTTFSASRRKCASLLHFFCHCVR